MQEDSMAVEPSQRTTKLRSMVSLIVGSKETPLPPQPAMGFFTDTSLCIGYKACEVACKQWNQLPASDPVWTGSSYDNTGQLSATTWRHVQFIEQIGHRDTENNGIKARDGQEYSRGDPRGRPGIGRPDIPLIQPGTALSSIPQSTALPFFNSDRWLMQSDVCKHCANAPCLEACPTGSIIRTEFDTVYVQQDI